VLNDCVRLNGIRFGVTLDRAACRSLPMVTQVAT